MKLVAARMALGTQMTPLDDDIWVADFYCPVPDCDCRLAVITVRDHAGEQLAAVNYEFRPMEGGDVYLNRELHQKTDGARWLERVRTAVVATRAQRAEFEWRYLEVKARGADPVARGHAVVRAAAGLPPLAPTLANARRRGRGFTAAVVQRDLVPLARTLVSHKNAHEALSGADLMALAMVLYPEATLTPEAAVTALHAGGLAQRNVKRTVDRITQSARTSGRFSRPQETVYRLLQHPLLAQWVDALAALPDLQPPVPVAVVTAPPAVAPAVVPVVPAAPVAPAVTVPPAAVFQPAPWSLPAVTVDAWVNAVARPVTDAGGARLALEAWRLASAAQFDELLAVGTLRDVAPHRYQTETVRRVLRALRGRAILADEVGLGKTVEAIMVLREYQVRGMVRRALVLAPAPLVAQWAGELAQKAGVIARTTDDPRVKSDPEAFWTEPGVVVASLALARSARHAAGVGSAPWDLVVVDEAHHVKNRATAGYKLVASLKQRFLLLVTATPVENDLEEIYNLVTLLRPGQFATPAAFRKRFVDPVEPTKPRDRDALRRLLGEVMVRNTRAQSGLALPPRSVSTVTVEPTEAERALYDAVVAFLRAHHEDGGLSLAASTLLLEAGSSPHAVRSTLARMAEHRTGTGQGRVRKELSALSALAAAVQDTRKTEALLQLVATHREPVLVFTRYRETLAAVVAAVTRAGVTAVAFHGGLDEPARAAALARFRAGGAVVMVATAAGSEGHNLQSCAVLVNFDLPWNPMAIEQRIGRLHRMGQTRPVQVYNLCAQGTLEARVLDVLDRRVQLFHLVVGEMDMVLGNLAEDGDLEDWLLASVARAQTDADVDATFDTLAASLLAARGRYEHTRALDEELFGRDLEA